mgnify:FL=1
MNTFQKIGYTNSHYQSGGREIGGKCGHFHRSAEAAWKCHQGSHGGGVGVHEYNDRREMVGIVTRDGERF